MRAKAMQHFKQGGKVMAITKGSKDAESIYDNPALYPRMFLWLFPYRLGGIGNTNCQTPIAEALHKQHLLMYHDKRFQRDPYFPLVAFNHTQIKDSVTGSYLLAHQHNFDDIAKRLLEISDSTLSDIVIKLENVSLKMSEMSDEDKECYKIINDLDYIGAHVSGSITSRKNMKNEIWPLMSYLEAPSWFIIGGLRVGRLCSDSRILHARLFGKSNIIIMVKLRSTLRDHLGAQQFSLP